MKKDRSIPEIYWDSFYLPTKKYDGRRFESLINDLLSEKFGNGWQQTPYSNDGGKDFVNLSMTGNSQWAECKMYKSPIGLKAISSTLVMAMLKGKPELLIFSYSRVTEGAVYHLSELARTSNMTIKVFDEDRLDKLLLSSSRIINKYFLNKPKAEDFANTELEVNFLLTRDFATPANELPELGHKLKGNTLNLDLYSPVIYDCILRNPSNETPLSLLLNYKALTKKDSPLSSSVEEKKLVLEPGEVRVDRQVLRANSSGEFDIPFPMITAKQKDEILAVIRASNYKRLKISLLHNPPLVGASVIKQLDRIVNCIQTSNSIQQAIIEGRSGVGKSRFNIELGFRLVDAGYRVMNFDSTSFESKPFGHCMKSLVANIWDLPDPYIMTQQDILPSLVEEKDLVFNYLYSDDINLDELVSLGTKLVVRGLQLTNKILIFDDVQFYPTDIVNLLRTISNSCIEVAGKAGLVLILNTDHLDNNDAAIKLRAELNQKALGSTRTLVTKTVLNDFTEQQLIQLIDTLLPIYDGNEKGFFSSLYPKLSKKIAKSVIPRPLYIWQLFHYWLDSQAVIIKKDIFIVNNFDLLEQSLTNLSDSFASVMALRMSALQSKPKIISFLKLLLCTGKINLETAKKLTREEADFFETLADNALIKISEGSHIEFYHSKLEFYFIDKLIHEYSDNSFSFKNAVTSYLKRKIHNISQVSVQNLRIYALGEENSVDSLLAGLADYKTKTAQTELLARATLEYLCVLGEKQTLVENILALTDVIKWRKSRKEQTSLLIEYSELMLEFVPNKNNIGIFTRLIHKLSSQAMSDGYRDFAQRFTEQLSQRFETDLEQVSPEYRAQLLCTLYNRSCVLYKDLNRHQEAIDFGTRSLTLASKYQFWDKVCLNYIDLGYIFYGFPDKTKDLLNYWQKAVSVYDENQQAISNSSGDVELAIKLIKGLVLVTLGDYEKGIKALDEMVKDAEKQDHLYYYLQGQYMSLLVKFYFDYLTKAHNQTSLTESYRQFVSIDDWVISSGIQRLLVPIKYFISIVLRMKHGDYERGVALLSEIVKPITEKQLRKPLYKAIMIDWIIYNKKNGGKTVREEMLIAETIEEIGGLDNLDKCPQITSFYHNGINFPYA